MSTLKNEMYFETVKFIEEKQNHLYRLAYSYMHCQETALDMVQETVYKALKSCSDIGKAEEIQPWIYRILVNTCLDELRKSKRVVVTAQEDIPEKADESMEQKAEHLALHEALENLEPLTKTVIVMRYFEDMKLSEIAEVLQESLSTVKNRLYRGLKVLKIDLEQEGICNVG